MAHDEKRFAPHHQLEKFYCPALRKRGIGNTKYEMKTKIKY